MTEQEELHPKDAPSSFPELDRLTPKSTRRNKQQKGKQTAERADGKARERAQQLLPPFALLRFEMASSFFQKRSYPFTWFLMSFNSWQKRSFRPGPDSYFDQRSPHARL